MKLRRKLICTLWIALPVGEQKIMVNDFLDWLYAELLPNERLRKIERLAPRLIEWISEGNMGLSLLIYQHLKRLPFVSTMIRWTSEAKQQQLRDGNYLKGNDITL